MCTRSFMNIVAVNGGAGNGEDDDCNSSSAWKTLLQAEEHTSFACETLLQAEERTSFACETLLQAEESTSFACETLSRAEENILPAPASNFIFISI